MCSLSSENHGLEHWKQLQFWPWKRWKVKVNKWPYSKDDANQIFKFYTHNNSKDAKANFVSEGHLELTSLA